MVIPLRTSDLLTASRRQGTSSAPIRKNNARRPGSATQSLSVSPQGMIPLAGRVQRSGRGSLRGRLVLAPDWDSEAVNESIATDFGMKS